MAADDAGAMTTSDDAVVVLSGGERRRPDEPVTLVEAAAAARAQRATGGPPVAMITDETLADENSEQRPGRGTLTFATTPPAPATEGGTERAEPAAPRTGEAYWRTTVRQARLRWRDAVQRVEELRTRVAGLRNAFYATDDPAYRGGVIKRDWDAAANEMVAAEAEIVAAREDLRSLLAAGRRAGALPGWLREGLELEPQPPKERRSAGPATLEPVEPPVVEEGEQP